MKIELAIKEKFLLSHKYIDFGISICLLSFFNKEMLANKKTFLFFFLKKKSLPVLENHHCNRIKNCTIENNAYLIPTYCTILSYLIGKKPK